MDLRHLRYFLCVAEEMHFGRAAQRLGISQPPLSQQIRALEDELGVRLFDRTSRRVRLTEAGELFVPEARQTLLQAERAIEIARLARRGELGRLRVGFTSSGPFVPLIASALYRFRESHRDVELTLRELGREEQMEELRRGALDIVLVRGAEPPPLPPDIVARCIIEEDMVVAMRAGHRLADCAADPTIADLAGVPLVLYAAPLGAGFNEHFFSLCRDAGFEPDIAHEASSFATLLGLVAAGFGATILARSLERLHLENVIYRSFVCPLASRLWLIHGAVLSPTAQAFRDVIDELRLDGRGVP
ncbi:LysR substrate-binding domain-containing protein [uncultured Sphingomonas sp.]|uniref:LysR substrate-binding domain-containing protein n=1 Tax=uncultured Sphingomonas sp. TaxID=158754 RepID=UPI002607C600|nr:LysR substrate-binding domain-containing protein [uncultured Sphingomonas sp.]